MSDKERNTYYHYHYHNHYHYCMASSTSGQDGSRSGLPAVSRKKIFLESHIVNPLLTKLVRTRSLGIGFVLFL